MATSGISSYSSNRMRLSGLGASGLDTDSIISQLMKAEQAPLDKLKQKKQLSEWKSDAYRDITNLLRSFKDEYFNVSKMSSNMTSSSVYKKYAVASSDSSMLTASANADAAAGTHTVVISNIATADKAVSSGTVTTELRGAVVASADVAALKGKKFEATLNGVTKQITIGEYADVDQLAAGLTNALREAFGADKITVANSNPGGDGALVFSTAAGVGRLTLTQVAGDDGLLGLKFNSGATNRLNTGETLETLAAKFKNNLTFVDDKIEFTINSASFSFDKSTSLSSMLAKINSDKTANVNIQYDENADKFILTSKQLGDGNNIVITQAKGNFFSQGATAGAVNIAVEKPVDEATGGKEGTDARVTVDNEAVVRNSNSFILNGVAYNLLQGSEGKTVTVSLTADVQTVYDTVKSFVDKYNEVIEKINAKSSEKYDRNYQPLTDDQKADMKEDDITKWEEKAKTGLLRNDSLLQNITRNFRTALYDSVDGVDINLSSIGITTGYYGDKGKLEINETKLKEAIQNNPDGVMELFAKKPSSTAYTWNLTEEERAARYKEEGLTYRLADIIDDNIRTSRDNNDKKGLLLEMAGMEGDASLISNTIYKQIEQYDNDIYEWNKKLADKEDRYYQKYATLEKLITQMATQSNFMLSQLGGQS